MDFPFIKSGADDNGRAFAARMKQSVFLVVDDFDSMRKVTINQLKQLGAEKFLEASNGSEALNILSRQPVTMVLSDWNMPVMDGLELLLAMRADAKLFSLPFLMITAETERAKVMQAIQSGVSELLVKPYTRARLEERLERVLNWQPRSNRPVAPLLEPAGGKAHVAREVVVPAAPAVEAESQTVASASTREKSTILVVDDTPDNLHLLSAMFKGDYNVKVANNGEKALAVAQSDTPPDLILLDIMMPGMDGFEVAQRLRAHPSSEHIPVIFVTAMAGEEARLKGMELGAVDYVTKPIDPDGLKVRVRNFMRYVELHRQLQADYDQMMQTERLKEDVERITRHDMRGPLAGVIGLVQNLSEADNLTAEQREQIRIVEETALQVLDMINLSNELFKIETGRFVLNPQTVAAAPMMRRIAEMQQRVFAVKNLKLAVVVSRPVDDIALTAMGDPTLCHSLFQNLIKNACEAAPENSLVTISIWDETPLRITINNSGAVPAAIRERFFEKFVTAGKQGGTGLGTYSAKLLAEAQNGDIALACSDADDSTTITIRLPRQQ